MNIGSNIRVRFAPSPTGHLHIGGLRTAFFNWLFARHTGGTYLMRVEDTDQTRSTQAFMESQCASLAWAGIVSDEPIVYQSKRQQEHVKAAHELMHKGMAYPCFCLPRESDDVVRNLEQGVGQKYDGTCRSLSYAEQDLSKPHAIRYKHDQQGSDIMFDDIIRGAINVKADQLDDFVIIRRDGFPTYNFCVVVDDIFMRITHIIRGEDHISNTPKQVVLYKALGVQAPAFAHLPLVLGKSGNKLSKRDAAVSVEEYRMQGYLPDALCNYLVRLGWSHGDQEIFTRDELVSYFTLEQVGKKGAIFDLEKLAWLNGSYIRKSAHDALLLAIAEIDPALKKKLHDVWPGDTLMILLDQYKQRATSLRDLCNDILALAHDDQQPLDLSLIAKWKTDNTKQMLADFVAAWPTLASFQHAALLDVAQKVCTHHNEKLVNVAQALRLAITGKVQSPGVFELLEIIGKDRAQSRVNALINTM